METEARVRWAALPASQQTDRLTGLAESRRFHRVLLSERRPIEAVWIGLGLLSAWLIGVAGVPDLFHRFVEKMS